VAQLFGSLVLALFSVIRTIVGSTDPGAIEFFRRNLFT